MKKILFIVFILLGLQYSISQNKIDEKHTMALLYLKTDEDINNKIKDVFKRYLKNKRCVKYVPFSLSDRIDFLDISSFLSQLKNNNLGIDTKYINDIKLFKKDYFFKSYLDPNLSGLIKPNDKVKLYLTFSKPFDNYLVAELNIIPPEKNNLNFKLGYAMQILFYFNSTGVIDEVLCASFQYN